MADANPFADEDDDLDRTVIRPAGAAPAPQVVAPGGPVAADGGAAGPRGFAPGGAAIGASAAQAAAAPPAPAGQAAGPAWLRPGQDASLFAGATQSRLIDAAARLIALTVATRDLDDHPAPDALLDGAIRAMADFDTAALAAGYTAEQIRVARYALSATLDDVVLATPWGGQTAWATRGLVSTLHRETLSGERFYDLLDRLMQTPDQHREELGLMYVCLSLGFEGKYRIMPRGSIELNRVRDQLYRVLTQGLPDPPRDLSPAWRGQERARRGLAAVAPLWLPLLLAALFGGLVYWAMRDNLGGAAQAAFGAEQRLSGQPGRMLVPLPVPEPPPPEPEAVPFVQPPAPMPPPPAPPPPGPTLVERVTAALSGDIAAGRVEVLAIDDGVMVRIVVPDQFRSGSATAAPTMPDIVRRIAAAFDPEQGDIVVFGHTDSVPMGRSARFPDNRALSLARAESTAGLMRPYLAPRRGVQAVGLGADEPIGDNATAEGRARNRRIEVVLLVPPDGPEGEP